MRTCPKCGGRVRSDCQHELCKACRKKLKDREEWKFHTTLRGQGRPIRYGGTATCKMPHCHRIYEVAHDMEARFSWYCPKCRREIEEITTGVLWLEAWGIILAPTEHIIEDSLVKAFDTEEVQHEETVRQKTGGKGRPPKARGAQGVRDPGVQPDQEAGRLVVL
jgi:hypothetical protein